MLLSKEENILFNAEKIFAEKGFDGTSTREISKAANVNISMISYYFGSKEKLYEKIFEFRMQEGLSFANDVMNRTDLNEWEKISSIITRYTKRLQDLPDFYLILQREQLSRSNPAILSYVKKTKLNFMEIYQKLMESGFQSKIFTKMPRLEFINSTISGTLFNASNSFSIYQEFFHKEKDLNYRISYFEDLNTHLINLLKNILGYEKQ